MSKGHRDNARARKKRGPKASQKRRERRNSDLVWGTDPEGKRRKCIACGTAVRQVSAGGFCVNCEKALSQ